MPSPIPEHLKRLAWYAPHQAYLRDRGYWSFHDPGEAQPKRADLSDSDLSYSNLSYSDLRDSELRGCNLSGCDLRYSDLRYSDLTYSDLRGSDLSDSNLSGCYLRGCNLSSAEGVATREECIARLDEIRTHIIDHNDNLDMSSWHGDKWNPETEPVHACQTTHCLAGWAQALSPDPEMRRIDPVTAGVRLIPLAVPLFWSDGPTATKWLHDREYAKA